MDEREQKDYERGYGDGYEAGVRGHLPANCVVILLPPGFEEVHESLFDDLTGIVHARTGNRAQVFRVDDLAAASPAGVG